MTADAEPTLLLSNDDGYRSDGIRLLFEALRHRYRVVVAAPVEERSAIGHAITFKTPLRSEPLPAELGMHGYRVHGTPADCVKLAITQLLPARPEIVVSGVNIGENTGVAVYYSGTVAAAREAAFWGVTSFAFSICREAVEHIEAYSARAPDIIDEIRRRRGPAHARGENGVFYNINFPACPPERCRGLRVTRQSLAVFNDFYRRESHDEYGQVYWLAGQKIEIESSSEFDSRALLEGYITVTPLGLDTTAADALVDLEWR